MKVTKPKSKAFNSRRQKQSKVVQADSLEWKSVDIPDNLESYEGFYGLEEIDGVDVEIINGKAQFKVRDDAKIKRVTGEESGKKEESEVGEVGEVEDEEDEDFDEEEFTGFDDDEEVQDDEEEEDQEISQDILTHKESTPKTTPKTTAKTTDKSSPKSNPKSVPEQLTKENAFANMILPDDDVNLPNWQHLDLNNYTLTGLNALNFKSPTPIQKQTIPLAIEGRDVIGKATTGSGKTLAYSIPILEKYVSKLEEFEANHKQKIINAPVGIIFVPTRELAHQVVDHLNQICKYFPIHNNSIVSITGGLSIQKQERLLDYGPSIIVATPGRCLELLEKSETVIKRLSSTDIIVLDEADRLLQDGHFDEFERILELFKKNRPKDLPSYKWQTLVFSATFAKELFGKLNKNYKANNEDDAILKLLNEKLQFKDKNPMVIDVNPKEVVSKQIVEALVECGATERDLYLYYFLLIYQGTTLVFANSIDTVKRLVPFLNNLNIPTFAIHSAMMQKQRLRSIEQFKKASAANNSAVLVASDVAARGLDIPNIDHVAHYHLPRTADVYVHRSGRTARAKNEGVSVMFCSPQESSGPLRKLRKLVADSSKDNGKFNIHNNVKLLPIEMDLVNQIKPRVDLSAKLADANVAHNSTKKEDNWVKQAADDLGIDDISELQDFEDDMIKRQRKRKENKILNNDESKAIKYELKRLLQQPIRKLNRRSYLTSGLENLAHIMVTGNTHKDVLGHENSNALKDLKGKGTSTKKVGNKNKITKNTTSKNKNKNKESNDKPKGKK